MTQYIVSVLFLGYYIYGEASGCIAGQVVRLLSKEYPSTSGRCMTFWYNMHGKTMGTFNIYIQSKDSSIKKIFTKSGNQGANWINGKALIQSSYNYKVLKYFKCCIKDVTPYNIGNSRADWLSRKGTFSVESNTKTD